MKKLPKPDHKYGYKHSTLREFFGEPIYKKFCTWMDGQTQMYCSNIKQSVAYAVDVERFWKAEQKGLKANIYD